MEYTHIVHGFEPVFDSKSRVLILGSLPSVKSRESSFYYGHHQNRFWKVIAALTDEPLPEDIPGKKALLLKHGIAVWDVIAECDIIGSADSTIKNVIPADLSVILNSADIKAVFTNGGTAGKIYKKYQLPQTGREAAVLPSTSPANAAWTSDRLTGAWGKALEPYLAL